MAKKRINGEGTIHKRKDGRWMAAATINGERVYFYGEKPEIAKAKLDQALEDSRKGIFVKNTKVLFGEWLDFWLNEIAKPKVKPSTYDYYEFIIRFHIKPQLEKIPLNQITTELLDQFYNRKKQEKKQRQKKLADGRRAEETLSKKLVGDIRKVIGMALKKAVVKKKISFNPNDATEPIGKDEPEIEFLTPEEIPEVIDQISDDYWIHAFIVALGTGLRVGELAGLVWGDINLSKGYLEVSRNISRINTYETEGPKTKLIIQTPKTKKSIRKVPLPLDVIKALKAVQAKQRDQQGNVIELKNDEPVFAWPDGRMVDPNYLSKHFKKLSDRFGSKDVHFHSLRHSYASLLLANGEELKVIQENLGHKDIKTTSNMYTHVIEDLKERSARRLDGFTKKKKQVV